MIKTHLNQERQAFGARLKTLRNACRLTLQDLEKRSGIKYSAIASIESGQRPAGEEIAIRLADGLMLKNEERESFLTQAGSTTLKGRYSSKAFAVGVEVLRALKMAHSPENDPQVLASAINEIAASYSCNPKRRNSAI